MKKIDWFELLLVGVIMGIGLYAAFSDPQNFSYRWFTRDDAYYYFKVAQNISEGYGSTFDGINPTNGYHPLWLLICIPLFALARFDLILPLRILLLVMSALSAGTGVLLYRTLRKGLHPALAMTAAIYWVFNLGILFRIYKQGLETGVAVFFVMLLVYLLLKFERNWRDARSNSRQIASLALVAALVVLSRLDLIFLAAIVGIWIIFRDEPIRFLLPLDLIFVFASVLVTLVFRVTYEQYLKYSDLAVSMIAAGLLIKLPGAYMMGLYQRKILRDPLVLLKRLTIFAVASSAVIGVLMILLTPVLEFEGFPRSLIIYDAVFTFILFGITRLMAFSLKTGETIREDEPSPWQHLQTRWRTWFTESMHYYGVVFGVLGIYMIWNKLAFDTFSPVSGQIKRYWGSLPGRVYGGPAQNSLAFFGLEPNGDGNVWHPLSTRIGEWTGVIYTDHYENLIPYLLALLGVCIGFCLLLLLHRRRAKLVLTHFSIIPLFCGAWLQVFYYHATGYSAYKEWYWVIQSILVVILTAIAAELIYDFFRQFRWAQYLPWAATGLTALVMSTSYWAYVSHTMPYGKTASDVPYNDIAAFLEANTPPGSIIGMTGGGNAGYFISDRTVINMDGLINSYDYFQLIKQREAGPYFAQIGMNYVLANPQLLDQLPFRKQFNPYLRFINTRYGGKELIFYSSEPQ